jgi:hypothetical protein
MAYSYQIYSGPSVTNNSFAVTQIDGYLQLSHLKVYKNDVLQASGYTFTQPSGVLTLSFSSAPAASDVIAVRRETPKTQATRVVDFTDGSVLTANDLDRSALQLLFIAQEAQDTGNGGITYDDTIGAYNAGGYRISNLGDPVNQQDAVTRSYVESLQLFGTATGDPQFWQFDVVDGDWTGSAGAWTASKELTGLYGDNQNMMIVTFGGVIQTPGTAYQVLNGRIYLYSTSTASPTGTVKLTVRNFGISRAIGATNWNSIIDKPAFGTASLANLGGTSSVPANATSTEAVRGNDPRLTDARTPAAHYNSYTTVTSTGAAGGETLATALANKVDKSGGTFATVPTCSFPPTVSSHLANKDYVDTRLAKTPKFFSYTTTTNNQALTVPIDVSSMEIGVPYVYYMRTQGYIQGGTLISPAAVQRFSFTIDSTEKLWIDDGISASTLNEIATQPTEFNLVHPSQLVSTVGTKNISCSDSWYSGGSVIKYKHSYIVVIRLA